MESNGGTQAGKRGKLSPLHSNQVNPKSALPKCFAERPDRL